MDRSADCTSFANSLRASENKSVLPDPLAPTIAIRMGSPSSYDLPGCFSVLQSSSALLILQSRLTSGFPLSVVPLSAWFIVHYTKENICEGNNANGHCGIRGEVRWEARKLKLKGSHHGLRYEYCTPLVSCSSADYTVQCTSSAGLNNTAVLRPSYALLLVRR